jgi:hypothetical protein
MCTLEGDKLPQLCCINYNTLPDLEELADSIIPVDGLQSLIRHAEGLDDDDR